MESYLDINVARIAHITLEMQLESVIQGKASTAHSAFTLPAQDVCELGVWLAKSEERAPAGHDTCYRLMHVHEQFHHKAQCVMDYMATAEGGLSQKKLADDMEQVRLLSREIIFLLTSIEMEDLDEKKGLLRRLFEDQTPVLSGKGDVLDVSHARLVHLHWLENLSKSFRNRGRHISLDSQDTCVLGVWIQNVGLQNHAGIGEMADLDNAHQRFHALAEKTIKSLQSKQDIQAEHAYTAVQAASREILYLLSFIESKLLDEASIRSTKSFVR